MKIFAVIFLIFVFQGFACADVITLDKFEEPQIHYSDKTKQLNGKVFIEDSETAQIIVDKQQESDYKDIELLWNATVNSNSTIQFALQKLSVPEEQRRIHSSLFAKTTSALLSGASMLPSFMGMHYAIQTASYSVARIANNYLNKKNTDIIKNQPLTDTEALHLATLIEDLQNEIVINYYSYKDALTRLKKCKSDLNLYNKNYHNALNKKDMLEIAVSSALWDEQVIEEYKLTEDVKKYQLMLIRLAGADAVKKLSLNQYSLVTRNVDMNDIDFSKKKVNMGDKK